MGTRCPALDVQWVPTEDPASVPLFKTVFVTERLNFLGTPDLEGAPRLHHELLNGISPTSSLAQPCEGMYIDLLVINAYSRETKDSQTPST